MKPQYYSQEALDKLKEELLTLRTKGRRDIAQQISEAREKGDLSENAEYDAAKEAQGHHEMKIAKLEEAIAFARVIDESQIDTSKVQVLSKVKLRNASTDVEVTYQLVSEKESDVRIGKISINSPIGQGLIGKVVGEFVRIEVPSGVIELEVLEIFIA